MAPSLWRLRLSVCEGLDREGLLGLLRVPRRPDHRGGAVRLCTAQFPGQSRHALSKIRFLVADRVQGQSLILSRRRKHFMRKDRILKVIQGMCALAVAVMLCAPAKADDKSAELYKQKC